MKTVLREPTAALRILRGSGGIGIRTHIIQQQWKVSTFDADGVLRIIEYEWRPLPIVDKEENAK